MDGWENMSETVLLLLATETGFDRPLQPPTTSTKSALSRLEPIHQILRARISTMKAFGIILAAICVVALTFVAGTSLEDEFIILQPGDSADLAKQMFLQRLRE